MKPNLRILAAALAIAMVPSLALAQATTNAGQANVAGRMASNFTNLAGGQANALALVNGLRTGGDITLTTTTAPSTEGGTSTTTETTFTSPTKPMGWGNVKHALALAQYQLTQAGITQPTPAQLQAALMGGDVTVTTGTGDAAVTKTTTMKGVLALRADGMGWGKIAQTVGTKLGPVNSTIKATNVSLTQQNASTTITTASGTTSTATTTKAGITTAAGTTAVVAHGNSARGITTATGGTASSGIVNGAGNTSHGNAYGKGMVTASGGAVAATTSGVTTAQGSGNGNGNAGGNGHGKGKSGG